MLHRCQHSTTFLLQTPGTVPLAYYLTSCCAHTPRNNQPQQDHRHHNIMLGRRGRHKWPCEDAALSEPNAVGICSTGTAFSTTRIAIVAQTQTPFTTLCKTFAGPADHQCRCVGVVHHMATIIELNNCRHLHEHQQPPSLSPASHHSHHPPDGVCPPTFPGVYNKSHAAAVQWGSAQHVMHLPEAPATTRGADASV